MESTKVIFKIAKYDNQKELVAIFPELKESNNCLLSYARIGQHSPIHESFLASQNAPFSEYSDLYFELISLGYKLDVLNDNFLENVDYFGVLQFCPSEVRELVDKYAQNENSYEGCEKFKSELNALGWTCNYWLDGQLFGLRELTTEEIKKLTACVCKNLTESDRNKLVSESLTSNK